MRYPSDIESHEDRQCNIVGAKQTLLHGSIGSNAPSTPLVDLADPSDSGQSLIDNITKETSPTLTGTAEAGSTVTITDGATVLATVTADGSGDWTFATEPLDDGIHSLTAIATDAFGNVSPPSSALVLTIDTISAATTTLSAANDDGTTGDLRTTGFTLRDTRFAGGVVVDVESGEIVCAGLSMPHSPCWDDGQLYVLNSGQGEFGRVDRAILPAMNYHVRVANEIF